MILLLISTHAPLIRHARQLASDDAHTLITASTVTGAVKACKLHQPVIILLDIDSVDVLSFVQQLSVLYRHSTQPTLIILSQVAQPCDGVLELGVGGFARYDDTQMPPLASLISHAQRPTLAQIPPQQSTIIIRSHRGDERILIDDIWYCQAEQKYTKIHHRHGVTLTDKTLKSLETTYSNDLIRIHRHTLVGIRHIQQISSANGHKSYNNSRHDNNHDGDKPQDKHWLLLYPLDEPFAISRRCLPKLRLRLSDLINSQQTTNVPP